MIGRHTETDFVLSDVRAEAQEIICSNCYSVFCEGRGETEERVEHREWSIVNVEYRRLRGISCKSVL